MWIMHKIRLNIRTTLSIATRKKRHTIYGYRMEKCFVVLKTWNMRRTSHNTCYFNGKKKRIEFAFVDEQLIKMLILLLLPLLLLSHTPKQCVMDVVFFCFAAKIRTYRNTKTLFVAFYCFVILFESMLKRPLFP